MYYDGCEAVKCFMLGYSLFILERLPEGLVSSFHEP